VHFLADARQGHAIGMAAGGLLETLDGFPKRLAAELERLMMDRKE